MRFLAHESCDYAAVRSLREAGRATVRAGVTVDEILSMLNIALGNTPVRACDAGDADHDGRITVDAILVAVNNAKASTYRRMALKKLRRRRCAT
jgi:hypothetical protein